MEYEIQARSALAGTAQTFRHFGTLDEAIDFAYAWVRTTCCAGYDNVYLCVGDDDNENAWCHWEIVDLSI